MERALFNVQQQVREYEDAAKQRSERRMKGVKRKAESISQKEWDDGVEWKKSDAKSKALKAVMNSIEQQTGKSIAKVRQLMTSLSTKLNKAIDGFDCEFVLDRSKQADAMEVMCALEPNVAWKQ